MPSSVVEQVVHARLILSTQSSAALRVTLRYRARDPLAVRMAFPAEFSLDEAWGPEDGNAVEWVFARQLLAAGLDQSAGLGDVRVRPAGGRLVMVELRAPEGVALLQFGAPELRRFLWHSYLAVPDGQEARHLDPDGALAELLR